LFIFDLHRLLWVHRTTPNCSAVRRQKQAHAYTATQPMPSLYSCPMDRPGSAWDRHGPGMVRRVLGRHGTPCLVFGLRPKHGTMGRNLGRAGLLSTANSAGRASPQPGALKTPQTADLIQHFSIFTISFLKSQSVTIKIHYFIVTMNKS
jgi:hypothetical protein